MHSSPSRRIFESEAKIFNLAMACLMRKNDVVWINSELLMCRKYMLIFTTNFVGSLDIRVAREVFPIGVSNPEISGGLIGKKIAIEKLQICKSCLLFHNP